MPKELMTRWVSLWYFFSMSLPWLFKSMLSVLYMDSVGPAFNQSGFMTGDWNSRVL